MFRKSRLASGSIMFSTDGSCVNSVKILPQTQDMAGFWQATDLKDQLLGQKLQGGNKPFQDRDLSAFMIPTKNQGLRHVSLHHRIPLVREEHQHVDHELQVVRGTLAIGPHITRQGVDE